MRIRLSSYITLSTIVIFPPSLVKSSLMPINNGIFTCRKEVGESQFESQYFDAREEIGIILTIKKSFNCITFVWKYYYSVLF